MQVQPLPPPASTATGSPSSSSAMSATTMQSIFEDFFNIDLLTTSAGDNANIGDHNTNTNNDNNSPNNTNADASSSRSSSHSPSSFQFPLTPPQQDNFAVSVDDDSLFSMQINDEYLKLDPLAGYSSSSFNFFGGMDALNPSGSHMLASPMSSSNMASGSTSTTAAHSPSSYQYAIDPQLVGTPGPTASTSARSVATLSDVDEDEEREDEEEDDGFLQPVKVGGKGKARKGTLQSGGVVKRTSAVRDSAKDSKDADLDNWRPSAEEYAKMSSKEKRQLRNKISARNFRVRRKEYIVTLEGDIAERDRLIDAIRGELGSTKSENYALRQEIATLKKAILEGRASPMLPPPAPLSPISPLATLAPTAASSTSSTNSSTVSPALVTPNTRKDLPTSPRLAAIGSNAFWGGSSAGSSGFGGFNGITPVHTALIPEFGVSPIVAKVAAHAQAQTHSASDNINPAMNDNSQQQQQPRQQGQAPFMTGFDAFQDNNMFTLKALDEYRMQLWGRMALQHHQREMLARQRGVHPHLAQQQRQQQQLTPPRSPLQGLASNLRPHYFTSTKPGVSSTTSPAPSLSALLSGKSFGAAGSKHYSTSSSSGTYGLPTPPTSPSQTHAHFSDSHAPNPQQAMLAALASQTLLQKMSSAFWDAFSGSSTVPGVGFKGRNGASHGQAHTQSWDAEKVRKVLEGTAVLRVVDIDAPTGAVTSSAAHGNNVLGLEDCMKSMSISSEASSTSSNTMSIPISSTAMPSSTSSLPVKQEDKSDAPGSKCGSFFAKCSIRSPVVASVAMKK